MIELYAYYVANRIYDTMSIWFSHATTLFLPLMT